ncbi:LacI family transcriptional regulator [Actinobacteria bacterium YIM 96077]|uniref:LacI family transcriptional regulator n=1 Tax=Phytoactinopolyspora halophila TaxID=1981511 RepID=A0A329QGC3_9ACTN|nr:LacI family DNA-binding transcriptional regulator [Phytoactinopolyspora halophila]AYY14491.1 LacI family transcriptional regulator [Actinobacteria bacterium YIM 96077]RAW11483.1 LacI family transcriptional regulator [Phytoactinopolyspora halophila]
MRSTIRDVARASGVHISTVSRTFSAPHMVNPETRSRVLATAASLGYRPNRAARALITGRTGNVGLIVADIANPFFPPLIKAAESQARDRDYSIFVAETDEDPTVEENLVRALAKQVDGVLLCSPRMSNDLIEKLSKEVPLVLINRSMPSLPCVLMDVSLGARQAVDHLIELGHSRVAILGGPRGSWTSREIRKASVAACRQAGFEPIVLSPNQPTVDGGIAIAERVVQESASAVVAYNDLMAIGVIEGLDSLGVRVPEDVSVIGFDDSTLARISRPRLTTVSNPTLAAGRTAVDMLLQLSDDRRATGQVMLQTELIVRASTNPATGSHGTPEEGR